MHQEIIIYCFRLNLLELLILFFIIVIDIYIKRLSAILLEGKSNDMDED